MKMKGGGKKKSGGGGGGGGGEPPSSLLMTNGDNEESSLHYLPAVPVQEQVNEEQHQDEDQDQDREQDQDHGGNVEEDDEDEQEEKSNLDADADGDGEAEERPKLDEGFYEIEAVRRKRIRKGQLQYLIKWRGWPETANTWEPLENLQSCSDVIDAFEDSLRLGKHSRKRKRKSSGSNALLKKKQQHSTIAPYNVTGVEFCGDETLTSASLNNLSLADPLVLPQSVSLCHVGEINVDAVTLETTKLNGGFAKFDERRVENEYDPKLSELKGAVLTNEVTEDKLAIRFQETKTSEGNCPSNRLTKVDCVEPAQNNRRTGARRRKSGSVKRFKQDVASRGTSITIDSVEQLRSENRGIAGYDSSHRNRTNDSRNTSSVIKIIQPISYSASISNSVQDVSVTFKAMRSDGKEVIVDNKFLKAHNPLLLIDFYEQHLKYNPTP